MEKKMSVMGVGAKIALPALVWLAASAAISWFVRPLFAITDNRSAIIAVGVALIAVGFSLNLAAAFAMLKAHQKNKLATGGLYAVFRDPMYVLQVFVTLPGLFLLFNSYMVLAGVIVAYISYRVFVREEHRYLEARFGEEYRRYLSRVPVRI
jgi:protein-S-isoprenylcysteine O-methyltransferase Ste14